MKCNTNGVSRKRMLYITMIRYRTFPVHSHHIFATCFFQRRFTNVYLKYRALSVKIMGTWGKKATSRGDHDMQCSRHTLIQLVWCQLFGSCSNCELTLYTECFILWHKFRCSPHDSLKVLLAVDLRNLHTFLMATWTTSHATFLA